MTRGWGLTTLDNLGIHSSRGDRMARQGRKLSGSSICPVLLSDIKRYKIFEDEEDSVK